jgi:RNA polymerase sigma-32 factor
MAHIDDLNTQKANLDYIRTAMNEPMLEKDEELRLATLWREDGDEKALHQLVQPYTRLVISIAKRFKNYGLPVGDLIQEGNIGLMQAAERFEPSRDLRFSTYATWWIRASIQDYVLRNWSIVRTGTTAAQKSLFFNFRRLRSKIEGTNEKEGLNDADREEIAKDLKVRVKDVEMMEGRLSGVDSSLNARIGDDHNEEWQTFLQDEGPNPEEVVTYMKDSRTRSEWIETALGDLSDREKKIIRDRHLSYDNITLEALGKQLGVSKERVRQIESRAMEKLKASLGQQVPNIHEMLTEIQ